MMELAKKIAARGPLPRTVIFCCFSGVDRERYADLIANLRE